MKRLLFLLVAATALTTTLANAQISKQIIGTWQMISTKFTYPDASVMEKNAFKFPAVRIFTKTYYSFGYQNIDGSLGTAVGGKYSIVGDSLFAGRNYHIMPSYAGTTTSFKIKIESNKLYIQGILPNKIVIEEVYSRIE